MGVAAIISFVDADPIEAAAETPEAAKIGKIKTKITKTKLHLLPVPNPIKRVPDTLTGPQIQPAPAIGQRARERPTVPTRSTAAGLASLHPENLKMLQIDKLACLE